MEELLHRVEKLSSHLGVHMVEIENGYILQGTSLITARYNDYSICKNYKLKIIIYKSNNNNDSIYKKVIPQLYVLKGIEYTYPHVYSSGLLCLDTDFNQYKYLLENEFDLVKWFEYFFSAFAVEYEYFKEYGSSLGMSRGHGYKGLFEVILENINISHSKKEIFMINAIKCDNASKLLTLIRNYCTIKVREWELRIMVSDYIESRKVVKQIE